MIANFTEQPQQMFTRGEKLSGVVAAAALTAGIGVFGAFGGDNETVGASQAHYCETQELPDDLRQLAQENTYLWGSVTDLSDVMVVYVPEQNMPDDCTIAQTGHTRQEGPAYHARLNTAAIVEQEQRGLDTDKPTVAAVIMAHEYAHAAQDNMSATDTWPQLGRELCADFSAGYFLEEMQKPYDVSDVQELMASMGRSPDVSADIDPHGTDEQRIAAALRGIDAAKSGEPVTSCDAEDIAALFQLKD